jgi:hypothetical protein
MSERRKDTLVLNQVKLGAGKKARLLHRRHKLAFLKFSTDNPRELICF